MYKIIKLSILVTVLILIAIYCTLLKFHDEGITELVEPPIESGDNYSEPILKEKEIISTHQEEPLEPKAFESKNWDLVKKNGVLVAEKYALAKNPSATFSPNSTAETSYQTEGKYKGRHLLNVTSKNTYNGDVSFAQLKPLFSIDSSTDELQLNTSLWTITTASLNNTKF